jgi:galactose mutarotase-like enzyme
MLRHWFEALVDRLWRRGVMRSGMLTGLTVALLAAGLFIAYREQGRGNLHRLKAKIAPTQQSTPKDWPGGQEAIQLTRARQLDGSVPEFLSVTMLPGRGMNILQISAYIPGKGKVNLLASPTVENAAQAMTGIGEDAGGQASEAMGGAFELPWAGRIASNATPTSATATWQGHALSLPSKEKQGGLMLTEAANSVSTAAVLDGGEARAVFHARDFAGQWPSQTDVNVNVLLGNQWIELTVVARNAGDAPEPIGIGWHPRFAIAGGNRAQVRLRVPAAMREEMHPDGQTATGRLIPVVGTEYNFDRDGGVALGSISLNDLFVALHGEPLRNGQAAELIDPAGGYGLRVIALSPAIRAMRVVAPREGDFVSIEPQFNRDDPFGREWGAGTQSGMVALWPGQSTQWRVRLELFSLTDGQTAK